MPIFHKLMVNGVCALKFQARRMYKNLTLDLMQLNAITRYSIREVIYTIKRVKYIKPGT